MESLVGALTLAFTRRTAVGPNGAAYERSVGLADPRREAGFVAVPDIHLFSRPVLKATDMA